MKFVIVFLTAMVATLIPSSATADDSSYHTPAPAIMFPVYKTLGGVDTIVQLEAPADSWKIRKSARSVDALIDGLTINTRGNCALNPNDLCVKVVVDYYTNAETIAITNGSSADWKGVVTFDPDNYQNRTVHLNTASTRGSQNRSIVAMHELGHALGLGHHDGRGMLGEDPFWHLNARLHWTELSVLRAWYANN